MKVKQLRETTGLTQSEFAAFLNLPLRTLQGWEQGRRQAPEYVVSMIERILAAEGNPK